MKNSVKINNFESATKVINETKAERKAWHSQEQTLARLLRKAQEKAMMPFSVPLFKKVGLPTNGKLTQKKYLAEHVKNFVEIMGEKLPAYVRMAPVYEKGADGKCLKDAEGKYVQAKNEKGEPVFVYKLTAIKPGTWTLEKLMKACVPA